MAKEMIEDVQGLQRRLLLFVALSAVCVVGGGLGFVHELQQMQFHAGFAISASPFTPGKLIILPFILIAWLLAKASSRKLSS